MVVDWEQETGLLMSSGDVRIVRIWDTEREMKVQVTTPARLEGLRALRLHVSASGRSAWDTAAGAPARAPGPGSSGDTLNQGVRARLRVPSFSSTERAERRFCPRPAGKVTADEGTGRGADALAGSVAEAAGPGPPPQSRAGSACTLDLPWGGGRRVWRKRLPLPRPHVLSRHGWPRHTASCPPRCSCTGGH